MNFYATILAVAKQCTCGHANYPNTKPTAAALGTATAMAMAMHQLVTLPLADNTYCASPAASSAFGSIDFKYSQASLLVLMINVELVSITDLYMSIVFWN